MFYICVMNKLQEFWYFTVKNRVQRKEVMGGFEIEFRQYDMRIRSLSSNFRMQIRAGEYAFGYLVSSLAQGCPKNVEGYATYMYMIATELCKDDGLRNDIHKALLKYNARLEKKARESVVEDKTAEDIAIDVEKSVIAHAGMSKKEQKKIDKRFKKAVKAIENGTE